MPGVGRIASVLEMQLDRMHPSAAELERIRLRLPELAVADLECAIAYQQGQTDPVNPAREPQDKPTAGLLPPPEYSELGVTLFGVGDFQLFEVEPTLPGTETEFTLRQAALAWRRGYYVARGAHNEATIEKHQAKAPRHILRLADIGRRFINAGRIDAAICELDTALTYYPTSAVLIAVRACAGLIGRRPSGSQIVQRYREQAIDGLRWEQLLFEQLQRLASAPGMHCEIVEAVETMLGCTRPSAGELREIGRATKNAAAADFPKAIFAHEDEIPEIERLARERVPSAKNPAAPQVADLSFLVIETMATSGAYSSALSIYFKGLDRSAAISKKEIRKRGFEVQREAECTFYHISNICLQLLRRGNFERVLSAVNRALATYPCSAKLHACRAAALAFLDRGEETRVVYDRLIARGPEGIAIIRKTFMALAAGGRVHPLAGEIISRVGSAWTENGASPHAQS